MQIDTVPRSTLADTVPGVGPALAAGPIFRWKWSAGERRPYIVCIDPAESP